MTMAIIRDHLYENSEDFFALDGSAVMFLSSAAAIEVCLQCASKGQVVLGIEGGNWKAQRFQIALDCIFDGVEPPVTANAAHENNVRISEVIKKECKKRDVFIVTSMKMDGSED
ncbi:MULTISPECIES: colicin immunity protein [Kordiimonas]|jgi:hypothetical protein|uniref:colicin immunity protein n=1 Tax=Kordiimonas TaxID=288021 RepID=UPI00257BC76B|nr:colicin immunity protein [Kordiimonas sp. UBA4487]